MKQPTASMIVIGDEILSGRTCDTNINYLARKLFKIGIDLKEVRITKDCKKSIICAVKNLKKSFDYVFTCGGIGPTHDDITTESIAEAFGLNIEIHKEAKKILKNYYSQKKQKINSAILKMAKIPLGASIIDNKLTGAPGFKIDNVYVMAGVPEIFKEMVLNILPNLNTGKPILTKTHIFLIGESEIASPLNELAKEFTDLKIGSYPFSRDEEYGVKVTFSGASAESIESAVSKLKSILYRKNDRIFD